MDRQLPPPDVLATSVPIESLTGTALGLARAASAAGYTIRATRALGPRVPRVTGQAIERQASEAIAGTMHGWAFSACHSARDGWDVILHRPGWPAAPSNVTALRNTFKAQTPASLGKAAGSR